MEETKRLIYDIIADAVRKYWVEESQHPEDVVVYFYQKYDFDGDDKWVPYVTYVTPRSSDNYNTVIFEDDFCEGLRDVKGLHVVSAKDVFDYYQTTIPGFKENKVLYGPESLKLLFH